MTDPRRQLRIYVRTALAPSDEVSAPDAMAPRRTASRRAVRALALAAAIIFIAAASWLVFANHSERDRVHVSSPADAWPPRWTLTNGPSVPGAGTPIAGSPRGVVIAFDNIWFSADGTAWTRAVVSGTTSRNARQPLQGSVRDIVAFGSGFVAGGLAVDPLGGPLAAAVWTSPDGVHWKRVLDPVLRESTSLGAAEGSRPTTSQIDEMAVSNSRIIAVGSTSANDIVIWTSDDGTSWQRVGGSGAFGPAGPDAVRDVIAYRNGFLAFVDDANSTVVYRSSGGTQWKRVAKIRGRIASAAADGRTLFAVGEGRIVTSSDGRTWRRSYTAKRSRLPQFTAVAANHSRIVAVGYLARQQPASEPLIVTSRDGSTWSTASVNSSPFSGSHTGLYAITTFAHRFLIVGARVLPNDAIAHPALFVSSRV
jgi:hypothetical protein